MSNQKEAVEQSMLAQQVYLDIVRSRHLLWANATEDPETRRVHLQIADLLQQTRDQYFDLLNIYRACDDQFRLDIHSFTIPSQL